MRRHHVHDGDVTQLVHGVHARDVAARQRDVENDADAVGELEVVDGTDGVGHVVLLDVQRDADASTTHSLLAESPLPALQEEGNEAESVHAVGDPKHSTLRGGGDDRHAEHCIHGIVN